MARRSRLSGYPKVFRLNLRRRLKAASVVPPESLFASITAAGITTGLKLSLDAGNSASYDGTAQQWSDSSGNAMHFNRGTTTGADATDPTFNGTAGGLSANEYFSFDGGDYFTLAGTQPAWVQTLHKAGGKGTYVGIVRPGAIGAAQGLCGTGIVTGSGTGFAITITSTGLLQLTVANAGVLALTQASTLALTAGVTYFLALSWDSAVGAGGLIYRRNADTDTDTSTYSSPSTGNATNNMTIGTRAGATGPLSAGSRLYGMAFWSEMLTGTQLGDLYSRIQSTGRFGI